MACAVALLYPIASSARPLDWWALIDVVAFAVIACGLSFLTGRTVERRAMRRKIGEVLALGQLPPSDVPVMTFSMPNAITTEQGEALRKRFREVYTNGPGALSGWSYLGAASGEES
jgi:hypothetical protein